MDLKLVLLDVDGTLLPHGSMAPPQRVVQAAKALQKKGVKLAIATGRSHQAVTPQVLGGLKPDYLICCNGACLMDRQGQVVDADTMTEQEMYALVDHCEDFDYPLAFVYPDGYYAYVEYQQMYQFYNGLGGYRGVVVDGEDQDRHLQGMPYAAFCIQPPEAVQTFQEKYGHLGLRFMPYSADKYDVSRADTDKAHGMKKLLELLELTPRQAAAVGDGANDVQMLALAGLGACVAEGAPQAQQAADVVLPPQGLAEFLEGLL